MPPTMCTAAAAARIAARCHVTKEWKSAKFDHLKETGFALLGAHDDIDCLACHRSGNYKDKIPKDCDGCHQADDVHSARFGSKCDRLP